MPENDMFQQDELMERIEDFRKWLRVRDELRSVYAEFQAAYRFSENPCWEDALRAIAAAGDACNDQLRNWATQFEDAYWQWQTKERLKREKGGKP